jgi:hypothetical protein
MGNDEGGMMKDELQIGVEKFSWGWDWDVSEGI